MTKPRKQQRAMIVQCFRLMLSSGVLRTPSMDPEILARPWTPPPTKPAPVEDPLAGFDAVLRFYGTDPDALRRTNPFAYLALGQAYMIDLARMQAITQACMVGAMAIARAASEQRAYVAAPGARKALRHSLHQVGVLR